MSTPVQDCPQREETPRRVRAYTREQLSRQSVESAFDAMFEPALTALAKASAEADKIHAAWEACNADD